MAFSVNPWARPSLCLSRSAGAGDGCGSELVETEEGPSPWAGHWLSSLFVRVPFRGRGTGSSLVTRLVEEAVTRGAPYVSAAVLEDNEPAKRLLRKHGFRPVAGHPLEAVLADDKQILGRQRTIMRRQLGAGAEDPVLPPNSGQCWRAPEWRST